MKITKPFCIDEDLMPDLQKINASNLVNELLKDYFNKNNEENLKKLNQKFAEIEEEKRKINRKRREIKEKIEKIKQKEARILKIFNKVPQKIVDELKEFPKLNLVSLRARYNDFYKRNHDFSWMELKQVFEELRK